MYDPYVKNQELIEENSSLKQRIKELERSESERKRVEDALRESEERYRNLFDNANEAIFVAQDGKLVFLNPMTEMMIGYTPEELMTRPFAEFIHPDDRDMVIDRHIKRMKGEEFPHRYSFRIIHRDSSIKWVELNALLINWKGKAATLNFLSDITQRKESEEALRKSEANYKQLFDNSPTAIYQIDFRTGKFLKANDVTCEYLGHSQKELTSLSPYDVMTDESKILFSERIRKMVLGEKVTENPEYEVVDKNGKHRWVQLNSKNIYDLEGLVGADVVAHDITQRKQAEEALRKSERRFRELAELLPETIYETDVQGTLTFVNRNAFDRFGYTQEDFESGLNALDMIAIDDRGRALESILRVMNRENVGSHEFTLQRKDGSTFPSMIHSTAIIHDGKSVGMRGFIVDITERKHTEEEQKLLQERLHRAEKMEALGTLAGGVAHDLNNVLGIVVGYAEMLLSDVEKSSSIRPRIENIMNGGQRAAAIVQDLLTLARRGVSGRDVINQNKVIVDCQQSPEFEKLYSYHPSVRIETDLEPYLLNISGSSVHLGKTLFNLVSNACEAMPDGGIVTIKTAHIYLDKPIQGYDDIKEGDYVVLSVSDTGEGISQTDLKRIFEPFYTKKVMGRSGTGLGLAVVWGTVKDHNGYINVQSEEGKGSTFTIYLPVTREDITAEAVAISISEYMGRGESILVVDDVKGQRDLASEMLRKLNYNVSTISSGEEAVKYLKEHKVDLLVLDMIMDPGMDGLDTYKSAIEIHPKQKAIIVSGFSESNRVHAAQALGAGTYVRKPYVLEKLGLAVRKELDRST